MSVLEAAAALRAAAAVLRAEGFSCADDDGGLCFSGPAGEGRIDEGSAGRVRLRYEIRGSQPHSAAGDPLALARLSARTPAPVRITLRRRIAVAEQTCRVAELAAALERMARLWMETGPGMPLVDLTVGVLDVALPAVIAPVFLRLAPPCTDTVDRARATFVLVANARLRAGKGGWIEGPGLTVGTTNGDREPLREEIYAVGHGLRTLGDERVARSYLELCGMRHMTPTRVPAPSGRGATTEGGPT